MPRFYFDTGRDVMEHDLVGAIFKDAHTAEREAQRALLELARDNLARRSRPTNLTINVRDERHELITSLSLTFSRHSFS